MIWLIVVVWAVVGVLVARWRKPVWIRLTSLMLVLILPIFGFWIWASGTLQTSACRYAADQLAEQFARVGEYPSSLSSLQPASIKMSWAQQVCHYQKTEDGYVMTFYAGGFSLGIYKNGELFFD